MKDHSTSKMMNELDKQITLKVQGRKCFTSSDKVVFLPLNNEKCTNRGVFFLLYSGYLQPGSKLFGQLPQPQVLLFFFFTSLI